MDQSLTKDARELADGVVMYLRRETKDKSVVPKVAALLTKVTARARKANVARVESSVQLLPAEQKTLARVLAKLIGHDVAIEMSVKPELIAGMRMTVGDFIVDTSFSTYLDQMAKTLL